MKRLMSLLLLLLMAIEPVLAAPTPPGPGLWKFIFGGQVYYNISGLTVIVEVAIPPEYANYYQTKPDGYVWQPGETYPVGSRFRIKAFLATKRRLDDQETSIFMALSKNNQSGFETPKEFKARWMDCSFETAGRSPGYMCAWIFGNADRDIDSEQPILINLESREQVCQRLGVSIPSADSQCLTDGQQQPVPLKVNPVCPQDRQNNQVSSQVNPGFQDAQATGTVKVLLNGPPRIVTVYSNGRAVSPPMLVQGMRVFETVPIGSITLQLTRPIGDQSNCTWSVRNGKVDRNGEIHFDLSPDGLVEFNMNGRLK